MSALKRLKSKSPFYRLCFLLIFGAQTFLTQSFPGCGIFSALLVYLSPFELPISSQYFSIKAVHLNNRITMGGDGQKRMTNSCFYGIYGVGLFPPIKKTNWTCRTNKKTLYSGLIYDGRQVLQQYQDFSFLHCEF